YSCGACCTRTIASYTDSIKVMDMTQNTVARRDGQADTEQTGMLPWVDVLEDANGITLYADLPGASKESLNVHVEAGTLGIQGEVALDMPQGMEAGHVEVAQPRYLRRFTLSKELDTEQVQASFEHGVLTLRIPKLAHAQPRRIQVQLA